jgi:N-acetylmuramoyl-L-alanine amidase
MTSALSQAHPAFNASEMPVEEAVEYHHDRLRILSDIELLACFIWGEARGEKVEGKLAIVHVVLNRVKARSYYGGTIREVILKPGHVTCFKENDQNLAQILKLPSGDREFALCKAIAELATRGHLKNDPTGGATHFHRLNSKPPWAPKLTYLRQIGNHRFYRESLNRSRGDHGLAVHKRGNGREL